MILGAKLRKKKHNTQILYFFVTRITRITQIFYSSGMFFLDRVTYYFVTQITRITRIFLFLRNIFRQSNRLTKYTDYTDFLFLRNVFFRQSNRVTKYFL
jgi:hypothetical protein